MAISFALLPQITLPSRAAIDQMWNEAKYSIHKSVMKTLGTTKPGKQYIKRDVWLWTADVKEKAREKKRLYHFFLKNKTEVNWEAYRSAKRESKKTVANARTRHYEMGEHRKHENSSKCREKQARSETEENQIDNTIENSVQGRDEDRSSPIKDHRDEEKVDLKIAGAESQEPVTRIRRPQKFGGDEGDMS
ncbi:hypothetical protein ACOME3_002969 [Neoechinorhynchus agilis]